MNTQIFLIRLLDGMDGIGLLHFQYMIINQKQALFICHQQYILYLVQINFALYRLISGVTGIPLTH